MRACERGVLPADLLRARDRFQAWRGRRQGRSRIPQPLWRLAVRLVNIHGVSRTATVLGLDYYNLKKHADAAAEQTNQAPSPSPAFVELPSLVGKQCHFELDQGAGASRRVHLVGYDAAEVEMLARCFWNAE